uniref:Uncharacterized protein n=1 Tax=Acanthochromis polyacanthus TaxID=80966 RepID=A0A3Q1F2T2_9TELE
CSCEGKAFLGILASVCIISRYFIYFSVCAQPSLSPLFSRFPLITLVRGEGGGCRLPCVCLTESVCVCVSPCSNSNHLQCNTNSRRLTDN